MFLLKNVGRRLKDTAERTYNVLNIRSTFSTYGTDPGDLSNNGCNNDSNSKSNRKWPQRFPDWQKPAPNFRFSGQRTLLDGDGSCIIQHYRKKQSEQNFDFSGFNQAMKWSAAIFWGFYCSQLICLYSRRRQNLKRWLHLQQFFFERSLRNGLDIDDFYSSNEAKSSQKSFVPIDYHEHEHWSDAIKAMQLYHPVPVNNDHLAGSEAKTTPEQATNENITKTLNDAIDHLMKTLGHIEFKLGVENIVADQPAVAVSHFKLATSHHHPEATFNLGVCYELGMGIKKDMKRAMECYRAASELGHKKAMYNLGVFYAHGVGGLKKDRNAAKACFLAADKMGLQSARTALDIPQKMRKPDDEIILKTNSIGKGSFHQTKSLPLPLE